MANASTTDFRLLDNLYIFMQELFSIIKDEPELKKFLDTYQSFIFSEYMVNYNFYPISSSIIEIYLSLNL